jgi:hypothetical protein
VKTEGDPHFESLQFIDSAGDWSPDNHRFVFSALAKGKPILTMIDVDSGRREAEYQSRRRRDLQSGVGTGWPPGRIHRHSRRAARSVCLRPHVAQDDTADE